MILPATVETMGLAETQGPRWVSVDDPQKSLVDEAFQYLHGNVYYSHQYELAFGQYMMAFGTISMTTIIDGPGMADLRSTPDGRIVIVNAREKLDFIWNCFFAEEPFIQDGKLHDSVQKAWSSYRKGEWDDRSMESFKPYRGADGVPLEFIGRTTNPSLGPKPKKPKLKFSRTITNGTEEFRQACEQLGKQRHFQSRDLKNPQEKSRFIRILQSIVEQCEDLESRFPAPGLDKPKAMVTRRIFYLPGPDG